MLTNRINRIARILVADWHASIKLTDSEWQELLEGELVTFHRPATRVLMGLEKSGHKVIKLMGPKGGAVEAMITDIYRDGRGDYEITAQLTDFKAGKRFRTIPVRPELGHDDYIVYRTPKRNHRYVVILHYYAQYDVIAGPEGEWVQESTYKGWYTKIPSAMRFYRIVDDTKWDVFWNSKEARDLVGDAVVVRTGVWGDRLGK